MLPASIFTVTLSPILCPIKAAPTGELLLMIPFASVLQTILREEVAIRVYHRKINPDKLEAHPPVLKSHLKERREVNKEKRKIKRAKRNTNSK